MAAGGLEAVRDALIVAHAEDMIDDEEFVLLYEYNQATPVFPYWKFQGFNLETWDDVECNTELRFEKKGFAYFDEMFTNPGSASL